MRLLMNVTMPHEPSNTAVRDGSVGEKLERILKETGPADSNPMAHARVETSGRAARRRVRINLPVYLACSS